MPSMIDRLPQADRKKVIDALLAGKSLRAVAKMAGVSHTVVDDYKHKVFLPTLHAANKLNAVMHIAENPEVSLAETTTLTRAALQADPILERIAKHRATVDAKMDEAEPKGAAALIGADLRGLELEARLTGRLDSSPNITTNLFVLVPAGSTPQQLTAADVEFVDE